ncbi:LysR substrate-binding domain-containing protein [Bradyrhizobium sp. BR13661]|jgi:DNA-binding transcriptional LysR family regulator|uniref:LysR substrate-binding domain-containing protein n=1 Tax=Bradyrhizobium sp. BR13661 TaxID=2940622 RepID=UPI002475E576|nr:LysR substrate-binding domain-containing protein [Bradyrhizobium sp. BR13661]MDH6261750.1 DNA-binding transcriptional LysR family regulator [Bradyrhizobium sp. BR13661]
MSAGPLVGTVRIGVTYTVSGYILPRHQMRFQTNFPGITIELFEAPREVLECALVDGALDLALMLVSNLRDNSALIRDTLLRSPRRLWLAPQHPLFRAERVQLAGIATYPYVMLTIDEAKDTSMRYWSNAALEPKTIFRTSSVEAVRSMVAGGMGIAILSDLIYRPWSHEGQRIETRVIEDQVPTMDVGLVWRRDTKMPTAAKAFRDYMRFAVPGLGPGRSFAGLDHRYPADESI